MGSKCWLMNESNVEPSPLGSSNSSISTLRTPTSSSALERIEFLSALSGKPVAVADLLLQLSPAAGVEEGLGECQAKLAPMAHPFVDFLDPVVEVGPVQVVLEGVDGVPID